MVLLGGPLLRRAVEGLEGTSGGKGDEELPASEYTGDDPVSMAAGVGGGRVL